MKPRLKLWNNSLMTGNGRMPRELNEVCCCGNKSQTTFHRPIQLSTETRCAEEKDSLCPWFSFLSIHFRLSLRLSPLLPAFQTKVLVSLQTETIIFVGDYHRYKMVWWLLLSIRHGKRYHLAQCLDVCCTKRLPVLFVGLVE